MYIVDLCCTFLYSNCFKFKFKAIVCDQDMLTTKQTTTNVPETTTMNEITTQSSTITTVPETTMMNETTTTMAPETTTFESPSTTEQETTTVMPTTSESPTTTEQETTSATPEPETTTAPKTIPKYTVTDGKTVCIVFQGEIRFNINYKTNDSEVGQCKRTAMCFEVI